MVGARFIAFKFQSKTIRHIGCAVNTNSPFIRELLRAYGFPAIMIAAAIIPGCNRTYSGHGGISWLVIPLCCPYILVRALILCIRGGTQSRSWYRRFYALTIPSYVILALPLSWAAAASIQHKFGLHLHPLAFFMLNGVTIPLVVLHLNEGDACQS